MKKFEANYNLSLYFHVIAEAENLDEARVVIWHKMQDLTDAHNASLPVDRGNGITEIEIESGYYGRKDAYIRDIVEKTE